MAPGLRALFHQERFYLDTLTNAKQFVENYVAAEHSEHLAGWKQRIDGLDAKFHANRLAIELSLDDDEDKSKSDVVLETEAKDAAAQAAEEAAQAAKEADEAASEESNRLIRMKFELDFVRVYGFLVNKIEKQTVRPQTNTNPIAPGHLRVKLPDVKLPMFDGSILEWITFRDSFKSLIDSNVDLSPYDKFVYLRGSMTPKARERIDNIDVTAANYPVAWRALESKFENKKLIFKAYMDALFAIEPMRKECYESLRQLVDGFELSLNMIKKLEIPTDGWSMVLAHMVCSRLDTSTLKQWESHYRSTDVPEYEELMAFLRGQLSILQSLPESYKHEHRSLTQRTTYAVTSPATSPCPFCSQQAHSPFKCGFFQGLSVSQRLDLVRKKNLCLNCLSPEHMVRKCSSGTCRVDGCQRTHHTMLHLSSNNRTSTPTSPASSRSNSPHQSSSQTYSSLQLPTECQQQLAASLVSTNVRVRKVPATVLLQTAIVKVSNSRNQHKSARALLDPASQLNLITERLVQKLKLRRYPCHQIIGGVGNSTIISSHAVHVALGSYNSHFKAVQTFHILENITQDLPSKPIDTSLWKLPPNVSLADPKFAESSSTDLLLGMELYFDILLDGFIKLGPEKPILQNTVFGWVASGKIRSGQSGSVSKLAHVCTSSRNASRTVWRGTPHRPADSSQWKKAPLRSPRKRQSIITVARADPSSSD